MAETTASAAASLAESNHADDAGSPGVDSDSSNPSDGEAESSPIATGGGDVPSPVRAEDPPKRLFKDPSDDLAEIYEGIDEALAEQKDAAEELDEARKNLEEAKAWFSRAEDRLKKCAGAVRAGVAKMEEAELKEPCTWNFMFCCLREYREKYGHLDIYMKARNYSSTKGKERNQVKREADEEATGSETTKRVYRNGDNDLSEDEENRDDDQEDQKKQGDDVGGGDSDESTTEDSIGNIPHKELANWVRIQRNYKNEGRLPPHRIRALSDLGLTWGLQACGWNRRYAELVSFKNEHGTCNVPKNYPKQKGLSRWCERQRQVQLNRRMGKKGAKICPEKESLLNALGFRWTEKEARTWDDRYADLCAFVEANGHANVPQHFSEDPALGHWVHKQRRHFSVMEGVGADKEERHNPLTDERIRMLDEIGFVWRAQKARGRKRKGT